MLDGVFAFVLLDQRFQLGESTLYVARDPYGVRPLYSIQQISTHPEWLNDERTIGFASELKVLSGFADNNYSKYEAEHFLPGTYSKYAYSDNACSEWRPVSKNVVYHRMAFSSNENASDNIRPILGEIQKRLISAVEKRCSTTERQIACLLSGGLDSSLITALVSEHHKREGLPPVETYSIGLADSPDLKCARMVADHLGTKHTEVILEERDFCEAIPRVIEAIESYDTTTVRASIGNFLLGEYIAAHSEAKVIFNGDGSDELTGGYLYMKYAPNAIEFDRECRRLLTDIHKFDVLRSDKSISSHGLEPRTPFLDREWTQFYLSISPVVRMWESRAPEKYLLRAAFSRNNFQPTSGLDSLLPDEVLWRKKEAFSDGVSGESRSLYQILQEYSKQMVNYDSNSKIRATMFSKNCPQTSEQLYYRTIFESHYSGFSDVVPYFWMPKYVEATDASARTIHNNNNTY